MCVAVAVLPVAIAAIPSESFTKGELSELEQAVSRWYQPLELRQMEVWAVLSAAIVVVVP